MPIDKLEHCESIPMMNIFKQEEKEEINKYGMSIFQLIRVAENNNSSKLEKELSILILKIEKTYSSKYIFTIPNFNSNELFSKKDLESISSDIRNSELEIKLATSLLKLIENDNYLLTVLEDPNKFDYNKNLFKCL